MGCGVSRVDSASLWPGGLGLEERGDESQVHGDLMSELELFVCGEKIYSCVERWNKSRR